MIPLMSVLIVCDGCSAPLDRERIVEVQVGRGTMVAAGLTEPRFVGSEAPAEYVLCVDCSDYLDRCMEVLRGRAA